jgi:hypothetical protein
MWQSWNICDEQQQIKIVITKIIKSKLKSGNVVTIQFRILFSGPLSKNVKKSSAQTIILPVVLYGRQETA